MLCTRILQKAMRSQTLTGLWEEVGDDTYTHKLVSFISIHLIYLLCV